jgi:hypothetical protein
MIVHTMALKKDPFIIITASFNLFCTSRKFLAAASIDVPSLLLSVLEGMEMVWDGPPCRRLLVVRCRRREAEALLLLGHDGQGRGRARGQRVSLQIRDNDKDIQ